MTLGCTSMLSTHAARNKEFLPHYPHYLSLVPSEISLLSQLGLCALVQIVK